MSGPRIIYTYPIAYAHYPAVPHFSAPIMAQTAPPQPVTQAKKPEGIRLTTDQLVRLDDIESRLYYVTPNFANYSFCPLPVTIGELKTHLEGILASYLIKETAELVIAGIEHSVVKLCLCVDAADEAKIKSGLTKLLLKKMATAKIDIADQRELGELIQTDYLFRIRELYFKKREMIGFEIDFGNLHIRIISIQNREDWKKLYFPQETWYVSLEDRNLCNIHEANPCEAVQHLQNRRLLAKQLAAQHFSAYYFVWKTTQGFKLVGNERSQGMAIALKSFMDAHSSADTYGLIATFQKHQRSCYDSGATRGALIMNWNPKNLKYKEGTAKKLKLATEELESRYRKIFWKAWEAIADSSVTFTATQGFKHPNVVLEHLKAKYKTIWEKVHLPALCARVCTATQTNVFLQCIDPRLFDMPNDKRVYEYQIRVTRAIKILKRPANPAALAQELNVIPSEFHLLEKLLKLSASLENSFKNWQTAQEKFAKLRQNTAPVAALATVSVTSRDVEVGKMGDCLNFLSFLIEIPDSQQNARRSYCKTIAAAWQAKVPAPQLIGELTYLIKEYPEQTKDLRQLALGLLLYGWTQNRPEIRFSFENEATPSGFIKVGDYYISCDGDPAEMTMAFISSFLKLSALFKTSSEECYRRFIKIPHGLPIHARSQDGDLMLEMTLDDENFQAYVSDLAEAFLKPPLSNILSKQFPSFSLYNFYKKILLEYRNEFVCSGITRCLAIYLLQKIHDVSSALVILTGAFLDCLKNPGKDISRKIEKLIPHLTALLASKDPKSKDKSLLETLNYTVSSVIHLAVKNLSVDALKAAKSLLQEVGPHIFTPKELADVAFELLTQHHLLGLTSDDPQNLIAADLLLDLSEQWTQHHPQLLSAHHTLRTYISEAMCGVVIEASEEVRANHSSLIVQHLVMKIRNMTAGNEINKTVTHFKILVAHALGNPFPETLVGVGELVAKLFNDLPRNYQQSPELFALAQKILQTNIKEPQRELNSLTCHTTGLKLLILVANGNAALERQIQFTIFTGLSNAFLLPNGLKTFKLYLKAISELSCTKKAFAPLIRTCGSFKPDHFRKKTGAALQQIFNIVYAVDNSLASLFFIHPKMNSRLSETDRDRLVWEFMQVHPQARVKGETEHLYKIWSIAKGSQNDLDASIWMNRFLQSLNLLQAFAATHQPHEYEMQGKAIVVYITQLLKKHAGKPTPLIDMDSMAEKIVAALKLLCLTNAASLSAQITFAICQSGLYVGKVIEAAPIPPVFSAADQLRKLMQTMPKEPQTAAELAEEVHLLIDQVMSWGLKAHYELILEAFTFRINLIGIAAPWNHKTLINCINILSGLEAIWTSNPAARPKIEGFVQFILKVGIFNNAWPHLRNIAFKRLIVIGTENSCKAAWKEMIRLSDPKDLQLLASDLCKRGNPFFISLVHLHCVETQFSNPGLYNYVLEACAQSVNPMLLDMMERDLIKSESLMKIKFSTLEAIFAYQKLCEYISNLAVATDDANSLRKYGSVALSAHQMMESFIKALPPAKAWQIQRFLILIYSRDGSALRIQACLELLKGINERLKYSILNSEMNLLLSVAENFQKMDKPELLHHVHKIIANILYRLTNTQKNGQRAPQINIEQQTRLSNLVQFINSSIHKFGKSFTQEQLYRLLINMKNMAFQCLEIGDIAAISNAVTKLLNTAYKSLSTVSLTDVGKFEAKISSIEQLLPLCGAYDPGLGKKFISRLQGKIFGFQGREQWHRFVEVLDKADQIKMYEYASDERVEIEIKFIETLCDFKDSNLSVLAFKRWVQLKKMTDHTKKGPLRQLLNAGLLVHDRLLISLLANDNFEVHYSLFLEFAAEFPSRPVEEEAFIPIIHFTWRIFSRLLVYPVVVRGLGAELEEKGLFKKDIPSVMQDIIEDKAISKWYTQRFPPNKLGEPLTDRVLKCLTHYKAKEDFTHLSLKQSSDILATLFTKLETQIRKNINFDPKNVNQELIKKFRSEVEAFYLDVRDFIKRHEMPNLDKNDD